MASRFEREMLKEIEKMKVEALTTLLTEPQQAAAVGRFNGLTFSLDLFRKSNRVDIDDETGDTL